MNPRIIKLIAKGHEEKIKEQDYLMWLLGQYFMSALDSTVCNSWVWRKKSEKPHNYIEKPILQKAEEKQAKIKAAPLTEEEKKRKTEKLFMNLRLMGANFNLNHREKNNKIS